MAHSQAVPDDHDAQRTMEQRSLRNVRALLDKLENEAEVERRTRTRIGWALVIAVAVVLGGGYLWSVLKGGTDNPSRVITIQVPPRR